MRELAVVLLTHFHDDHVGGTPGVLGRTKVGRVIVGEFDGAQVEQSIRALAAANGVPVLEAGPGWSQRIGGTRLEALGPPHEILGTTSDPNNNSLLVRVEVGGTSMLITGDAQIELEESMLDCDCLRADVLKVPHHGSKNRSDEFLAATHASVAIISVGADNDYGHPAPSTLTELRMLGMAIWRTDHSGTIVLAQRDGALIALTEYSAR